MVLSELGVTLVNRILSAGALPFAPFPTCKFPRLEMVQVKVMNLSLQSTTFSRISAPFVRISGTYIAWPSTGSAWNEPGASARIS